MKQDSNIMLKVKNYFCKIFRTNTLSDCWQLRNRIYEQHMDYLRWLKDIHELESW